MEIINEKTGRPPKNYTDAQWQQDLTRIKATVKPSSSKRIKTVSDRCKSTSTYHGKTQYQYYCDSINDILSNLRDGNLDYCYYIYQIAELLKYEYENLRAVWLEEDRCFELSLNK